VHHVPPTPHRLDFSNSLSFPARAQERAKLDREKAALEEQRRALSQGHTEHARAAAETKHLVKQLAAAEKEVKAMALDVEKLTDDNT
jgi:hypothetical protein